MKTAMDPAVDPLPSPPSRTRRAMALVRRWLSAATGLGMLIITLSGMLLPHQAEILHSLNPTASTHDADPGQVSLPQAVETIKNGHPDELVLSATWDTDVVEVRTEQATYGSIPPPGTRSAGRRRPRPGSPPWTTCTAACCPARGPATCTGCLRRFPTPAGGTVTGA